MHPATANALQFFTYDHLPGNLQVINSPICELAKAMAESLPEHSEVTRGLWKLMEAKDCFVRAELTRGK